MTDLTALRAQGLLQAFGEGGVLSVADVQVALRLGALTGESDDRVLLAVALVVRGTRLGSVVFDLADAAATVTAEAEDAQPVELPWPPVDEWAAACASSPLVEDRPGGKPLHVAGSRLWLDRYWRQEARVARDLSERSRDRPSDLDLHRLRADLDELFPDESSADQRVATGVAARSRLSVIAGGPGTG